MMDYYCPKEIAINFATEELAQQIGRSEYLEWLKTLPLKRGDRVEVLQGSSGVWWEYEPIN